MERNDDMITYGRTCVYHLNYHIVWGIKHRNKVLNGSAEADLIKLLYDIADEKGFIIKRVEIRLDDHVHMIVSAPPKISVSTIVDFRFYHCQVFERDFGFSPVSHAS